MPILIPSTTPYSLMIPTSMLHCYTSLILGAALLNNKLKKKLTYTQKNINLPGT
jgi:hypothetical protein